MVKVISKEDCGNAPRKLVLRDWLSAFAGGDLEAVLEKVADNVVWTIVGQECIDGKESYQASAEALVATYAGKELIIENIITHGTSASANGVLTTADGRRYAFCDVYLFNSFASKGKLKEITSYWIELRD